MFTGIIEEIGEIKEINRGRSSIVLTIKAKTVLSDVKIGDSIAASGVCLTVTSFTQSSFKADVMPETMNRTNYNKLTVGSHVNLERAMLVGSRFGGHIVSGHVDGIGKVIGLKKDDNAVWVTIEADENVMKYIIGKGSITIDGISLTVASVTRKDFKVSIIPMTASETTLLDKRMGDTVNLECDVVGKYVERFTIFKEKESKVTMDFLRENGF